MQKTKEEQCGEMKNTNIILTIPVRRDITVARNVDRGGLSLMGRAFVVMGSNLEAERDPSRVGETRARCFHMANGKYSRRVRKK